MPSTATTTPRAMAPARVPFPPRRSTPWRWVLAVAGLALGARLAVVLHSGGLGGIDGYDDGVYYASAASFVFGKLPYRDFLLVHPPGLMLVLTPFAAIGRLAGDRAGFELARLFTMLVGAANTALIVLLARRRLGTVPAVVAGVWYAVWPLVLPTETTIRLEPLVSLGLLLGLSVVVPGARGRRRSSGLLVAGGVALGFAMSVKVWAVIPALVIVWWAWRWWGRRGLLAGLGGIAVGGLVVDGPFWLAAPGAMWRMVVSDQLGRGQTPVGIPSRLVEILVPGVTPSVWWSELAWSVPTAVCLVVAVVLACRSQDGRAFTSLLVATAGVLILSPSFYSYYPAFAAPFVALVVGGVVAALRTRAGARSSRRRPLGTVVVATVVVGALGASIWLDVVKKVSDPFPAALLARAGQGARCVTSDSPDALLLTGVYTRNLRRGCRAPVDLSGLTYDVYALPLRPDGTGASRAVNVGWQAYFWDYLLSGQTAFLMRPGPDGFSTGVEPPGMSTYAAGTGYAAFVRHPATTRVQPSLRLPRAR